MNETILAAALKEVSSLKRNPDIHTTHNFHGFGKCASACDIKIWFVEQYAFILMTDTGVGTSVTNAAEIIISSVYQAYLQAISKENCIFMETYDEKEGIDLVIPDWSSGIVERVSWRHIGKVI